MHSKLDAVTRTSDALPLLGSFDLANPQSALALAHFMFSLSYQSYILQEELPSRRLRNFTWRSDDDAALWAGSIEEWRAHIDVSEESRYEPGSCAVCCECGLMSLFSGYIVLRMYLTPRLPLPPRTPTPSQCLPNQPVIMFVERQKANHALHHRRHLGGILQSCIHYSVDDSYRNLCV